MSPLWATAFEFGLLFICKAHFSAFWTSIKSSDRYCHPRLKLELGFMTTDFMTDLLVILLPLPQVVSRRLSQQIPLLTHELDLETSNVNTPQGSRHVSLLHGSSVCISSMS